MLRQRSMLRATAQLRSSVSPRALQRRLGSTEQSGFHGAEDNAFNRERKAVKEHAAATSGEDFIFRAFQLGSSGADTNLIPADLWRKLSI